MGFFDKLIGKSICVYCGEELPMNFIPFTGTVKLEDGKLCKKCSALLSPWLSTKKKSMKALEVFDHMEYREANAERLKGFQETLCAESRNVILAADPEMGCMIISKDKDYRGANADLLPISGITEVNYLINENHFISKSTAPDGKETIETARYNYNFKFTVTVEHPWITTISFDVDTYTSVDIMRTADLQRIFEDGEAICRFFESLGIPVNYSSNETIPMEAILSGEAAARLSAPPEPPKPAPQPVPEDPAAALARKRMEVEMKELELRERKLRMEEAQLIREEKAEAKVVRQEMKESMRSTVQNVTKLPGRPNIGSTQPKPVQPAAPQKPAVPQRPVQPAVPQHHEGSQNHGDDSRVSRAGRGHN